MNVTPIAAVAHGLPGELVVAAVRNPIENRYSSGKPRPAVIVDRVDGHYRTMGLTSKGTYKNGAPRVPVPDPATVGLRGPGYLWGDHLTNVSVLDIGNHIGWVDSRLAEAIIQLAELPETLAELLRAAAAEHHPDPGESGSEPGGRSSPRSQWAGLDRLPSEGACRRSTARSVM